MTTTVYGYHCLSCCLLYFLLPCHVDILRAALITCLFPGQLSAPTYGALSSGMDAKLTRDLRLVLGRIGEPASVPEMWAM